MAVFETLEDGQTMAKAQRGFALTTQEHEYETYDTHDASCKYYGPLAHLRAKMGNAGIGIAKIRSIESPGEKVTKCE